MKNRGLLLIFVAGCAILFAILGTVWAKWHHDGIAQILIGALGVTVLVLMVRGILASGKERWITFTLGAILLLGFSISFFSAGFFTAPVALFLLGFSLGKLTQRENKHSLC
jgi:hypothetical protein